MMDKPKLSQKYLSDVKLYGAYHMLLIFYVPACTDCLIWQFCNLFNYVQFCIFMLLVIIIIENAKGQ